MLNRQRAQLSMGAHANRALQKDRDELGSEAFEFEVLDELTPDAGYGPHPSPFSRVERKMPGNSRN
jgi:hypothetical protein